jgi:DNA topoisomerase I
MSGKNETKKLRVTKKNKTVDGSDQGDTHNDLEIISAVKKTPRTKKVTKVPKMTGTITSRAKHDDENENDKSKKKVVKKQQPITKVFLTNTDGQGKKKLAGKKGSYILVIVESPGKIKKLESILGPGYVVTTSFGHIMDLHPKKMSIDFENNFDPEYHILTGTNKFQDKTKVVQNLVALAGKASKIIIAADDDREGEMIGWSYKVVIGIQDDDYERIQFNSITKDEVKRAIANPGKINMLMVNSQKARRVLDRLFGFKISPCLNQIMGMGNLSAGRVQSIVVELICDKEQEINNFFQGDNASYFRINGNLVTNNPRIDMKCELISADREENDVENKEEQDPEQDEEKDEEEEENGADKMKKSKITSYGSAHKIMMNISTSTFRIHDVLVRKSTRYPAPPFTTSTAQQDASTKLGFNVSRTMGALQKLYEAGYTTYLRTDSTVLSSDALKQCEEYIKNNFGDDYHNLKNYTNKKGNTQEAHEAIRPVDITVETVPDGGKIGADEQKMYQLVWKRTVASQMAPAQVDQYTIDISISKEKKYFFRTTIDDITFSGFLAIYGIGIHGQPFDNIDKNYRILVPVKKQKVEAIEVRCAEEYKKPPLRYSEAGLVKKMDPKNLNIGRPATYQEIINTIQKRKYVEVKDVEGIVKKSRILTWTPDESNDIIMEEKTIHLGREKKKFCPTELGMEVNTILVRNFPDLMEYGFTANMEAQLDEIAAGNRDWVDCVRTFWKKLEAQLDVMGKERKFQRILGKNPKTGHPVIASMGQYGPILTMGRSEKKTENTIVPIKKPLTLGEITLEQALEVLKYPKILGVRGKKNVELKIGAYGFYVTCEKEKTSIPPDIDPDTVTVELAIQYLAEKMEKTKEKNNKYLFYHKEGNIEYIVANNKSDEKNKYLMVKDVTKKKAKPMFLSFPADEDLDGITFERIKDIAREAKKKKKKSNVIPVAKGTPASQFKNQPVDKNNGKAAKTAKTAKTTKTAKTAKTTKTKTTKTAKTKTAKIAKTAKTKTAETKIAKTTKLFK